MKIQKHNANDYKKLQNAIAEYMDKSISFYDAGAEAFYHGWNCIFREESLCKDKLKKE